MGRLWADTHPLIPLPMVMTLFGFSLRCSVHRAGGHYLHSNKGARVERDDFSSRQISEKILQVQMSHNRAKL
jgi:hypothetical protein